MIYYLKKYAGKENITVYISLPSNLDGNETEPYKSVDSNSEVAELHHNVKHYQINSRGIRKILMNRNDEYKEYYLTLEDLWNEL